MTTPGNRFRPLLDARAVADRWGFKSVRSVFRLVREGKLKKWPHRVNGRVVFRVHDVLAYEKNV